MNEATTTIPADVLDAGFITNNSKLYVGMRWHLPRTTETTEKRTACDESVSWRISGHRFGHKMSRKLLCQKCLDLFEAAGRAYPDTCTCGHC